jgi:hypothetical protein
MVMGIVSFVLSLAIAGGTVFSFANHFVTTKILWKGTEQAKIDKLAPTQTLSYFNSVLGEPNTKELRGKIAKYTYKERGYWVEAFVDEENVVQVMDVTACGDEKFYPIIKNNPMGNAITLGKTKMNRAVSDVLSPKIHYYHKLATAPSYYYDEYYNGAAGSYQTMFTGHNELCGYLVLPTDIVNTLTDLDDKTSLSETQIRRIRSGVTINTFAVTSPSFITGLYKDLGNYGLNEFGEGGIGVSYVDKGILTPSKEYESLDKTGIEEANDFDVINFN